MDLNDEDLFHESIKQVSKQALCNRGFNIGWWTYIPKLNSSSLFRASFRISPPKLFLYKDVLKICSKFTGKHPCQSVISIKLPF